VLRFLTVFSVVLLPLTLITGFFGMNVNFPGFGTTWAFWTITGVMFVAFLCLLSFFRHKRWI
jgi:magnesium transporter